MLIDTILAYTLPISGMLLVIMLYGYVFFFRKTGKSITQRIHKGLIPRYHLQFIEHRGQVAWYRGADHDFAYWVSFAPAEMIDGSMQLHTGCSAYLWFTMAEFDQQTAGNRFINNLPLYSPYKKFRIYTLKPSPVGYSNMRLQSTKISTVLEQLPEPFKQLPDQTLLRVDVTLALSDQRYLQEFLDTAKQTLKDLDRLSDH